MKKIFYSTIGLLIAGVVLLPINSRADVSQNAGDSSTSQEAVKKETHQKKTKKADKKPSKKASFKKDMPSKEDVKDKSSQNKKTVVRKKSKAAEEKSPVFAGHAMYVASKNSPKKYYHLATSAIAKRIKSENLIEFSNREDAEKAGYHPDKDVTKQ